MRINNNLIAMNTTRTLGINVNDTSKAMEKLSSGQRINKAADDAAGLSISEKMRGQIRGLSMASKNTQDAISLFQTADGALAEVHEIAQRIRVLSVQSSKWYQHGNRPKSPSGRSLSFEPRSGPDSQHD